MSEPPGIAIRFAELSHRLLAWFFEHGRELPWRGEHDPYRVWISEVMLQQTRSTAVAGYYGRWLERFPTIESLAQAELEEVLKAWEGLGYYSRARNLHASARVLVEDRGGSFPDTEEELRSLPGIGEYTAAAISSIAFARPVGVVDGNVLRVVSRLLADAEPSPSRFRKQVRAFVEASFLDYHPGWINQAWMELGALVCTPLPRCAVCPLAESCRARIQGRIEAFPPKTAQPPLPVREQSALLLLPASLPEPLREDLRTPASGSDTAARALSAGALIRKSATALLLVQRAEKGLLGGLWELPNFPERGGALRRYLALRDIEILLDTGEEVRHRYSHFEVRFQLSVAVQKEQIKLEPWRQQRWVLAGDLERYGRPKAHILAMRRFGLLGV